MSDLRILSPERIAEIKARERAATKGPWIAVAPSDQSGGKQVVAAGPSMLASKTPHRFSVRTIEGADVPERFHPIDGEQAEHNAAFIAAARADVPALLAHADALAERPNICQDCGHVEREHDGGENDHCSRFDPLTADAYRAMRRAMLKDRETTRAIVEATKDDETIKQLRAVAAELRDVRKQLREVTAERDALKERTS